jgi:organic hydroperoxide reductase OsmC/OhrA
LEAANRSLLSKTLRRRNKQCSETIIAVGLSSCYSSAAADLAEETTVAVVVNVLALAAPETMTAAANPLSHYFT